MDDRFIFWRCSWSSIKNLHNLLQNVDPKIKLSIEHNFKDLTFLGILIENENAQIISDIYHKSTDTQQYLHFMSNHAKDGIKSITLNILNEYRLIYSQKNI